MMGRRGMSQGRLERRLRRYPRGTLVNAPDGLAVGPMLSREGFLSCDFSLLMAPRERTSSPRHALRPRRVLGAEAMKGD